MKSGKITVGLIAIAALIVGSIGLFGMSSAYAVTTESESTTAAVTVNGLVSITMFNVPINFPAVDPGVSFTAANATKGFPMIVQVDNVTNVDVDVFINGSDFAKGGDNFGVGNLSFNVTGSASGTANTSCSALHSCIYQKTRTWVFNETARLGTAANSTISHWISVPGAQAPGAYTNNVEICAKQVGGGGCA
jgi:hypothetical protein